MITQQAGETDAHFAARELIVDENLAAAKLRELMASHGPKEVLAEAMDIAHNEWFTPYRAWLDQQLEWFEVAS